MCAYPSEQSKLYVFFNLSTRLIIIICIFETIVTIITVCMYYYCQPNPRRSMKKSKIISQEAKEEVLRAKLYSWRLPDMMKYISHNFFHPR